MQTSFLNQPLKVTVMSPERTLMKNQECKLVMLTGSEGQIEILPGHINMVGMLDTGQFSVSLVDGKKVGGFISTGFFEVHQNQVTVTAETLELENEINVDRAQDAESRARSKLKGGGLGEDGQTKHQLKLQRARVRQGLAKKRVNTH